MATYIASNANRDFVTITLSKAEANALFLLAYEAETSGLGETNHQHRASAHRAMDALAASINKSARRAGWFD